MPKRKCRILADNVLAEVPERRKIMDERICGYCAYHKKDEQFVQAVANAIYQGFEIKEME